jgi:hypothetical protein
MIYQEELGDFGWRERPIAKTSARQASGFPAEV